MPNKTQQKTVNSQTTQSDLEIETQAHSRAFIGLFFIVLGSYLLLANLGYIEWLSILKLIKYWPLLLVFWGLKLLIKNNFVWRLISIILSLLLIFWLLSLIFDFQIDQFIQDQWHLVFE
jgi:hypothetical protein